MKISTLSIVCGSSACNAKCPYCVSKMTPTAGVETKLTPVHWRNFRIACQFAKECHATTAMITGKGEPTLFPGLVGQYVSECKDAGFSFIEMQTNGLVFETEEGLKHAKDWYEMGMTTVSLSIMHPDVLENTRNMYPYRAFGGGAFGAFDFWKVVDDLHEIGLSIRMNLTMSDLLTETDVTPRTDWMKASLLRSFDLLVNKCREHKVEQITVRNLGAPDDCDNDISKWIHDHRIDGAERLVASYLENERKATTLLKLGHGATVYDWDGQNVCVNNCLTETTDPEDIRQLIFFPDGHLRYSWKYLGAIIL